MVTVVSQLRLSTVDVVRRGWPRLTIGMVGYLGLQYLFKAGYDPNAFTIFFERVAAETSPGKVSTIFSTHPPTRNRISLIQKEIATILPARDEYIVTTSEFDLVKNRLLAIGGDENRKGNADGKRPKLRRRTEPSLNDTSMPDR